MNAVNQWYLVALALALDLAVGDPVWLTHPVVLMGGLIRWLDVRLRHEADTPARKIALGFGLWLAVVALTTGITWAAITMVTRLSVPLALLLNIWLCSTTVAANGLGVAGRKVGNRLRSGDLQGARQAAGEIVGRDTQHLGKPELIRAAIESVAENTVDGVIAPLVFIVIGGAPLAMAYRAINTMDSVLGYKDKDYLHFGRAAARLDDAANYLPARFAGLMLVVSAAILGMNWRNGLRIWMRDAHTHPSPNAGVPESVVAGSMGLRLGGVNYYDGQARNRATMGDAVRQFEIEDINQVINQMVLASVLGVAVLIVVRWLLMN